jgi:hypothetical protein
MQKYTSKTILIIFAIVFSTKLSYSQDRTDNTAKYLSWGILQTIPSPVLFQDSNDKEARVIFGLRWQITPVNISFRSNRFDSPFQFFMINPVRKFTGSVELFLQPELASDEFEYSSLSRFGLGAGSRLIIPISGDGQNISASIGGKYNYRKDFSGGSDHYFGIETGIYFIYGILGIQFNYNFDKKTKYNIGIYFKFF